jgi:putative endonuclease
MARARCIVKRLPVCGNTVTEQRLALGQWGEQQAARYLRRRLYRIVANNYRCRHGEIDLIVRRGKTLAFVEVKTRKSRHYGDAREAVTLRKQQQIIAAAQHYLVTHGGEDMAMRFDVVTVHVENDNVQVEHLIDAFDVS